MPAQIDCPTHGAHPAAFVCRHLSATAPTGVVVGGDVDTAAAVCADCDARIQGDWNALEPEDMEACCLLCFGDVVARAQDLSGLPEPAELFATACNQMIERNNAFLQAIDHDTHARWAFTADRALAFLGPEDTARFVCPCDTVGSYDATERVWMWAWANDTLPAGMRARAAVSRSLGDRLGLGVLAAPTVPEVTLDAAWHLAQLGGWLVGAHATYQLQAEGFEVFVAIADVQQVAA